MRFTARENVNFFLEKHFENIEILLLGIAYKARSACMRFPASGFRWFSKCFSKMLQNEVSACCELHTSQCCFLGIQRGTRPPEPQTPVAWFLQSHYSLTVLHVSSKSKSAPRILDNLPILKKTVFFYLTQLNCSKTRERVPESLWKPHQSKDMLFLNRYSDPKKNPTFFCHRKKNFFRRSKKYFSRFENFSKEKYFSLPKFW